MQEVKKAFRSKAMVAIMTSMTTVLGTYMATEWPAIWRAMCLN